MKKKNLFYLVAAFLIFGCILGLYKINALIPDGIFVSGVPVEEIQEAYQDLYAGIEEYDKGEISDGMSFALLIMPKESTGQILAFTLKERYADAYVRDLATERRMRLAGLEILACLALFGFLNPLIFKWMGEKGRDYHYFLRIGEFFVLCFMVSRRGVLPSVCIPEKFIYWGEWWEKCREYFNGLKLAGRIPCADYQAWISLQTGLLALFFVGTVVLVSARITQKRYYKTL